MLAGRLLWSNMGCMGIIEPQAQSKSATETAGIDKAERLKDLAFSSIVRLMQCLFTHRYETYAR